MGKLTFRKKCFDFLLPIPPDNIQQAFVLWARSSVLVIMGRFCHSASPFTF
jgi:hypothetical protein